MIWFVLRAGRPRQLRFAAPARGECFRPQGGSAALVVTGLVVVMGLLVGPARGDTSAAGWTSTEVRVPKQGESEEPPIVSALAIRAAGDRVAIGGDDHLVRVWDLAERRFVAVLSGHRDLVRCLAYTADGSLLASAGNDGRIIVWDTATGEVFRAREQGRPVTRILFTAGGSRLATIGFRSPLRLFDVRTGAELHSSACPCEDMRALAISPDGRMLVAGGRNGKLRIWDSATGEVAKNLAAHRRRIRAIGFSPDGQLLASGGDDRSVRVSRPDGSEAYVLKGPPAMVMSLSFCGPRQLAVGGSDNQIRVWNLESREIDARLAGHTGSVTALVHAAATLVSAGYDTTVRVWRRDGKLAEDDWIKPGRVGRRVRLAEPR